MIDRETFLHINRVRVITSTLLFALILYIPLVYLLNHLFSVGSPGKDNAILGAIFISFIADVVICCSLGLIVLFRLNRKPDCWYGISIGPSIKLAGRKETLEIDNIREVNIYCRKRKKPQDDCCFVRTEDSSYLIKWHSDESRERFMKACEKYIVQEVHEIKEKEIHVS